MTALELHRKHPALDLAPILRVIKYMGLDSNALSQSEVDRILKLYPHFERDPELVVGIEALCRLTEIEAERLSAILTEHRNEIPYLGTTAHPMVPTVAVDMIRAIADGDDPLSASEEDLFTLTEMAERTGISMASLSKYVKEHPDRIPSRTVGRMRRFPREATEVFHQIKAENLGRRGNGQDSVERQKAAVSKRYAAKLADIEEQLDAAVEVSRELSRTLNRLSRQVGRARAAAESGSKASVREAPGRSRRSGGHRPDTIVAACKKVLANADGPMRVADITERVIAMGTPIKAKNPNVTVSSILSSYDDFGRVRRGYYELLTGGKPASAAADASPADDEAKGREAPDTIDSAVASTVTRDAEDILAGLQAAADSAERAEEAAQSTRQRHSDGKKRREKAEGVIGLEPFGATG
ncbi:MAG: hypothetical protein PVJ49_20820 [Acidobacteriota bacterium]|jgi:hypothetical protein